MNAVNSIVQVLRADSSFADGFEGQYDKGIRWCASPKKRIPDIDGDLDLGSLMSVCKVTALPIMFDVVPSVDGEKIPMLPFDRANFGRACDEMEWVYTRPYQTRSEEGDVRSVGLCGTYVYTIRMRM